MWYFLGNAKIQDKTEYKISEHNSIIKTLQRYGLLVIELFSNVFIGSFLGYWLDFFLGSTPAFIIGGVILGAISGFLNLFRKIKNAEEIKDEK